MSERSQFDIVIAGGGVIGLACAWRLGRSGRTVCVLERDRIGAGASGVAAGMLAPVGEAHFGEQRHLDLNLYSHSRWPDFSRRLAEDSARPDLLRRTGALHVALDRDEQEALRRLHRFQLDAGLEAEWITPSACRELEPSLSPRIAGGVLAPEEGAVDPVALLTALEAAARQHGVEIREGEAVRETRVVDGSVTGVRTSAGAEIGCDALVVATGAWTGSAEWLPPPARPPVRPVKGQILTLRAAGRPPIGRIVVAPEAYLVPRDDGSVVVGATVEEMGFDTRITAGAVRELLREAHRAVPEIAELELVEARAGLRPVTPSNLPLIGPGRLEGLVLAAGHFRNGILLAPATAEAVECAVDGATLPAPVAAIREGEVPQEVA